MDKGDSERFESFAAREGVSLCDKQKLSLNMHGYHNVKIREVSVNGESP